MLLTSSPGRRLLTAAAAAAVLLVGPAVAQGDQIASVSIANGDAVVDRPIVLQLQGFADDDVYAYVDINPVGLPCAQTHDLNANNRTDQYTSATLGKGAVDGYRVSNVSLGTPGAYTACAYFERRYTDAPTASQSLAFTVRDPRVSLSMALLAAPVPSAPVPLSLTTYAEVARELYVDLNAEGIPCGLNTSVNNGDGKIYGMDLLGGPTTSVTNITMPSTAGRYHLCGYIGRSHGDATPLAVVDSGSFLVGTPPAPPAPPAPAATPKPSCTVGPRTVKSRGTLGIRCKNVSGSVEIRAKRGGRTVKVTRRLVGGVAKVRVKTLRMKRGVTKISVFQGRAKLAGRSVRRR